jgi:hypothetical protein
VAKELSAKQQKAVCSGLLRSARNDDYFFVSLHLLKQATKCGVFRIASQCSQ